MHIELLLLLLLLLLLCYGVKTWILRQKKNELLVTEMDYLRDPTGIESAPYPVLRVQSSIP